MKYQIWATIEIVSDDEEDYIEAEHWPVKVFMTDDREKAVDSMILYSLHPIGAEKEQALKYIKNLEKDIE